MSDKEKKITWKAAFRDTRRALGLISKEAPGFLTMTVLKEGLEALTPYVTVYLSARILDGLVSGASAGHIWQLIGITLAATAILTALRGAFDKKLESRLWKFQMRENLCYDEKFMALDYADVDDTKTRDMLSQILQNRNWQGFGVLQVALHFPRLIRGFIGVLGAIALTVSLFLLPVPEGAGALQVLNSPWFVVGFGALLIAVTALGPLCDNKSALITSQLFKEATFGNRVFSAFGFRTSTQKRAEDVRMYNQQVICRHYLGSDKTFSPGGHFAKVSKGIIGFLAAASGAVSAVVTGIAYLFVCLKAWAGAFGIGAVTQYVGAITAFTGNLALLLQSAGALRANAPFLEQCFAYLDLPNNMYQGSLTTEKRSDRKYDVEFRDVSFCYPGSDAWALRHVNMKFRVGERLAVVGENGSGKTTFIKLLCRLYDPQEGQILLNGIDIRKYRYDDYINVFSVVFQDFKLLSQSLGSNVAGGVDYDRAKAEKALTDAGFADRLKTMPQGLDTYLDKDYDDSGVEVSGGEAQKIAIARALYKDAPFIILDEPTAALDPIAEAEIYARFNDIVTDKTAVYISHRLSSCKFCDEILVFDHGSVIQQGTHEDLVKQPGKYQDLWEAQAQYYVEKQAV